MGFTRGTSRAVVFILAVATLVLGTVLAGCGGAAPAPAPAKPAESKPTESKPAAPPAAQLTAQPAAKAAEQEQLTFKAGSVPPLTDPITITGQKFAKLVGERTNGKVKIDYFGAGQIGGEIDMVEGIRLGTVGMVLTSTTGHSLFDVLWVPFTFRDREHMWKVFNGPIGEDWNQRMIKERGTRVLGYGYRLPRNLTTSKVKVTKVADMKGLKVRVPEAAPIVAGFKAFGANPTPMAWAEVFTALQQGTVDGQENPMEIITSAKLWEVQKYVHVTEHVRIPWINLMDERIWQKMTPATQKIVKDTWTEVSGELEKDLLTKEAEFIATVKKNGMTVVQSPELDVQSLRDAVKDVWKDFAPKAWGEGVWEKVQATK